MWINIFFIAKNILMNDNNIIEYKDRFKWKNEIKIKCIKKYLYVSRIIKSNVNLE